MKFSHSWDSVNSGDQSLNTPERQVNMKAKYYNQDQI